MNILDWIIIAWLVLAFLAGARSGFIFWVGTVLGFIAGIYIAGIYYPELSGLIGDSGWAKLIAFKILLILCSVLGGIAAKIINKLFNLIKWIPFLKTANRILGGLLAVIVNVLFISIVLYFASHIYISDILTQTIAESRIAAILLIISTVVSWVLPDDITDLTRLF